MRTLHSPSKVGGRGRSGKGIETERAMLVAIVGLSKVSHDGLPVFSIPGQSLARRLASWL